MTVEIVPPYRETPLLPGNAGIRPALRGVSNWTLTLNSIPPATEKIAVLLQYAILAPSSHNTQPWRFKLEDNRVYLYADRARALPVNDPENRELVISCGCALMNLRVAAAHAGLRTQVREGKADEKDLLAIAEFEPATHAPEPEAELFEAITQRRTYRKPFEPRPPEAAALALLSEAAGMEKAWLELPSREATRRQVAEQVAEGDARQWANPNWRRELAKWIHSRRRGDGLPLPGPISPMARLMVRALDMGKGIGARNKQLVENSPVIAVLGTGGDAPRDWLRAGQALERVLLTAHGQGLQASHLNQPVQVASLRPRLQQLLAAPGFPQIVLRLGFPGENPPASPRRPLEDVII